MRRFVIQIEDLHGTHFFGGFVGVNGQAIRYADQKTAVIFTNERHALLTGVVMADLMDSWGLDAGVFVVEVDQ